MKIKAVLTFVLVAACQSPVPDASPGFDAIVDATASEWRASGLDWRSDCDEERPHVRVSLVDEPEMRRVAGYCAAGSEACANTTFEERVSAGCVLGICAAGATFRDQSEVWPAGLFAPTRTTLLISALVAPKTQRRTVVHEAAHWLAECGAGNADGQHTRPEVWAAGGLVRRVQAMLVEP